MVQLVFSGGQTGVDRAALDAAITCGIAIGGWCPRGRLAEDGIVPPHYPLRETPSSAYEERTWWNVRDSDATLVVVLSEPDGGTAFTIEIIHQLGKPYRIVKLNDNVELEKEVRQSIDWINKHHIRILNVAGPRESREPGIYKTARKFLEMLLQPKNGLHK